MPLDPDTPLFRDLVRLYVPLMDPVRLFLAPEQPTEAVRLISDGGRNGRWSWLMLPDGLVQSLDLDNGAQVGPTLSKLLKSKLFPANPEGPPFQGGLVGLLAYSYGSVREPVTRRPDEDPWPVLMAARINALLAFDHNTGTLWAVGCGDTPEAARKARQSAEACAVVPFREDDHSCASQTPDFAHNFVPDTSDPAYQAAVSQLVGHIGAGEVFQANLTRGWTGTLPAGKDPLKLARHLFVSSPAPYSAFWSIGDHTLICNSPERFLSISPSGIVSTCPIKGTRPRHPDLALDSAHAAALPLDPKERAENLMIVDLMRNDLGRVCAPGSVRVTRLFDVETFANVHHLVSEVQGQLAADRSALDLLLESFPPGSITGAPKVRAMQLLNDLEPPRGPYCGSLFWIGDDGAMDSSVLIRTLALTGSGDGYAFRAAAGAGIVADSRPEAECAETHTKISRIRAALFASEGQA